MLGNGVVLPRSRATIVKVNEGRNRSDVPYLWPPSLLWALPRRRSVYLDLNHWIGLAKAATGHSDGARYVALLELAERAVADGEVIFPLSGQHYAEMAGIGDARQREDIATVMRELSQFSTLLCRSLVMRLELEAALDARVGRLTTPYSPLMVIGTGAGHAFGVRGQFYFADRSGASAETIRQHWPGGPDAHDELLAKLQYMGEWMLLRGPTDEDLPALRSKGFDPTVAKSGQEQRARQEREQAERFNQDPRWRRGRIRDVVATRYVVVELMDMLLEGLLARGATVDDLVVGDERAAIRSFVDGMPSADVHVSLQVVAHSNPQSAWTSNDYFDIDALSLAVPYCDVVATDRQRAHDLRRSACPKRLDTTVVSTPEDLVDVLST